LLRRAFLRRRGAGRRPAHPRGRRGRGRRRAVAHPARLPIRPAGRLERAPGTARMTDAAPLAVVVLFAAPVAALLIGFLFLHRVKPSWTYLPILASNAAVAAAAMWLASKTYTGWT